MISKDNSCGQRWFAAGVLCILIVLIYSNSFHASWQMDDYPNITSNTRLHITNLAYDTVLRSFFANPQISKFKELYRPVACLSFGLNWLLGEDDVFGYHLVNIAIHILTAILLYLTILALCNSPRLANRYRDRAHVI
ncbi:MAG: hypothetical protein P8X85_24090, partial [Desulfobacterales bacterium]